MIAPDQDLDALFKRLHLANARRVWRDLVQRAERDAWWERAVEAWPDYANYQQKTDRELPVIRLLPRSGSSPRT